MADEATDLGEPGSTIRPETSSQPGPDGPSDAVRAAPVDVHPPTRFERIAYGGIRLLALALAKIWVRLSVVGGKHIPARGGPYVMAPVHRSNLDFLLVALLNRRRMRYMAKASLWKWRPGGKFIAMLGGFPVHRGSTDRAALRTCLQVIENGESVVLFPEGTRRSGATVDDVFDGPAYVACRAGVPVVPIGIGGSDKAMPRGAKWVKPRKITLVVGHPLDPPPMDSSGRVPRRAVRELTRQLRDEVQTLYDRAQQLAG